MYYLLIRELINDETWFKMKYKRKFRFQFAGQGSQTFNYIRGN